MSSIRITTPAQGTATHVAVQAGQNLVFPFDLAAAEFSLAGKSLVIDVSGSGKIVLDDFMSLSKTALPEFTLVDGTVVRAADYLSSVDPDLMTAAGPTSASAASSGLGEYSSDAGSLVGGVDRLGSLGTQQWGRDSEASTAPLQSTYASSGTTADLGAVSALAPMAVAVTPGVPTTSPVPPAPVAPPAPVLPPDPIDGQYVSRAVLYKTSPAAGDSLTFEVLYNGHPVTGVDPQTLSINSATGWAQSYFDREHFSFDPATGRLTLSLTEAGKAAMAGNKVDLYDYITVTVGNGSYTVQLVVNQTGTFNSAVENTLVHDGFSLQSGLTEVVWGEWHNEDSGSSKGIRYSEGGHDRIVFHSATDIALKAGAVLNAGDGDNSISISGTIGMSGSTVITGSGRDVIEISGGTIGKNGGLSGAVLSTGAGDDSITISGRTGVLSSTIDTGTGHDTLTITGNLAVYNSTINMNADALVDTITITGGADNAMQKSVLNAGDGSDVITLSNNMDAPAAVLDYGSVVNLGKGHDTLTITGYKAGTSSTINADADDLGDTITMLSQRGWQGNLTVAQSGVINMGAGNDLLDIRTEGEYVNGSQGVDSTIINMGTGRDTIKISGTSDAGTHSTINAGVGDTFGDTYILEGRGNRGWQDGTINAGDSNDLFTITAATSALVSSTINAGAGADSFDITAGGVGLSYSTINANADNVAETIMIHSGGDGLYQGVINAGGGSDHIEIHAGGAGMTSHSANTGSVINLGEGDNTLIIESDEIVASTKSQIISGSGDDFISLASHGATVLASSSVDTGAGDDTLYIDYAGDVTSAASNAPTSYINLGDGNDLVMFHSGTGNLPNSHLMLSGGNNDAYSSTTLASGETHVTVGDILGFNDNLVHQLTDSPLSAAKFLPGVSGFESLMVDYSGTTGDTINLDSLLNTVDKLNDTNRMSSIIIKGDTTDVMADMHGQNAGHHVENVSIDGIQGVFNQYTVHHGDMEMQIFIQTLINQ